jgi:C1A family cysteine protease
VAGISASGIFMKERKIISGLLVCLFFIGFIGGVMATTAQIRAAEQTETPIIAPFCSAYVEWLHQHSIIYTKDAHGHGLGLIPAPVDLAGSTSGNWGSSIPDQLTTLQMITSASTPADPLTGKLSEIFSVSTPSDQSAASLPKITKTNASSTQTVSASGIALTYDLRTNSRVPTVKDQGQDGNCWAFASISSLESSLLPGERDDFSENNMKNLHGFDVSPNSGGNDFMATAYLARWSGPVRASDDPYSDGSTTSPGFLAVQKHVQNVIFIPARLGPLENDQIKSVIMQYGAVYSTFHWEDTSYNYHSASYYYSGSSGPNHAIDIVGWDDTYDRNNFPMPAPGNGAFIAQNSWGSNWGEGGYFYISYYDTRIGRDNAMFTAQASNNYARIYQYDPLGWVANFGMGSDTAYYANVFTASGSEQLKAVSFYTTATSADYELKVFLDPDHGPVSSAGYVASQSGTMDLPGYHTVSLSIPVALKSGQKFSVAVKVHSSGWEFPVAIEYPISGYTSGARASPGQSYISSDGGSWSDLTSSQPNTNVCLKAFTMTTITGSTSPTSTFPAPVFTKSNTGPSSSDILKKLTGSGLLSVNGTFPQPVLKSGTTYSMNITFPAVPKNDPSMGRITAMPGNISLKNRFFESYPDIAPPAIGSMVLKNLTESTTC